MKGKSSSIRNYSIRTIVKKWIYWNNIGGDPEIPSGDPEIPSGDPEIPSGDPEIPSLSNKTSTPPLGTDLKRANITKQM
jgi:hypothetical protein